MAEISVHVVDQSHEGDDRIYHGGATALERFQDRMPELADAVALIVAELQPKLSVSESTNPGEWRSSEVTLRFALDLEVEAGVIIARTTATAAFAVEVDAKCINRLKVAVAAFYRQRLVLPTYCRTTERGGASRAPNAWVPLSP
jgi:Trypsin-co-occurring domain 1